jgi:hypothetical protein
VTRKKKKRKITMTVIIVSPQKKGSMEDKGMSKTLSTICLPIEQQSGKTIAVAYRKEDDKEKLMKFYPFTKDMTMQTPLPIMMMKQLLEEAPLFLWQETRHGEI